MKQGYPLPSLPGCMVDLRSGQLALVFGQAVNECAIFLISQDFGVLPNIKSVMQQSSAGTREAELPAALLSVQSEPCSLS